MSLYSIPPLIGAAVAFTLGIFVFHKRLKDTAGRVFFFLMLACAVWNLGEFMMQSSKSFDSALLWAKISNLGLVFIPLFLVRFAYVYPKVSKEPKLIYLPPCVIAFLILFTESIVSVRWSATKEYFECAPGKGWGYTLFMVFFFFYMAFSAFVFMNRRLKLGTVQERKQAVHLSIGIVGIMGYSLTEGFLGALIPVTVLDSFLSLGIASFFAYATIRYQLFDIRVHIFIRKVLISACTFAMLLGLFLTLVLLFSTAVKEYFLAAPHPFYIGILFIAATLFRKIDQGATFVVESIFPGLKWKESEVGEIFLIHKERGIIVSHVEISPQIKIDKDIAAGMLSAVQDFLGETLKSAKKKELNILSYGGTKLLIEHGNNCYMVVVFTGYEIEEMRTSVKALMHTIDEKYNTVLSAWDGDMDKVKDIAPVIKSVFK